MKQFEYKTIRVNGWMEFDLALVDEGNDGWELICFKDYITEVHAYFKRENE